MSDVCCLRMIESMNAHQDERVDELKLAHEYWHAMYLKLSAIESSETIELIKVYQRHKRLLKTREQLLANKHMFGPMKAIRLLRNADRLEKAAAELKRRREIVSMLRKQNAIACEESDKIVIKIDETLFW